MTELTKKKSKFVEFWEVEVGREMNVQFLLLLSITAISTNVIQGELILKIIFFLNINYN